MSQNKKTLNSFKCFSCETLPATQVFVCKNEHYYCVPCSSTANLLCECKEKLKPQTNPLQDALEKAVANCLHKSAGCQWEYALSKLKGHISECKYRPSKCIGSELDIWQCNWMGRRHEMKQHFQICHRNLGEIMSFNEDGLMHFQGHLSTMKYINLISAFNKTFVFYYLCDLEGGLINIIIFLIGGSQEAQKYSYELEIYTRVNKTLKIKFNQDVCNDTSDISAIVREGKCVCLPLKVIKNYLQSEYFQYRFRLLTKKSNSTSN